MDDPEQYCNYPEVSKKTRHFCSVNEQWSLSSHTPSVSDLSSSISGGSSQSIIFSHRTESLVNYLPGSAAPSHVSEDVVCEDLERTSEESVFGRESILQKENVPYISSIDPNCWIRYASDRDPWNKENYTNDCPFPHFNNGILNRHMVSKCTSKLIQLPDTKHFVFSRLHLNNKDLEDISVLSEYRYFQYIDLSWNYITDLNALNNCNYLMYLNVAHNKLSSVLDFSPPWFLTHVDLSCNQIYEIGENLSHIWSLRYIDLSYNNIEKIGGFCNLKYLRYLNLSHNHIKNIESLECTNLQDLYLQYNDILEVGTEGSGFNNLKNIKNINMSRNKISQLHIFKELYTIEELDVSDNCINNLAELDNFIRFTKCFNLNMTGNFICSTIGYRELVIYKIPRLKLLDSVIVTSSEKVAARILFEPDVFTRTHYTRAKLELWKQLANQDINKDTVQYDQPHIPMIILVGTFDNGKEALAQSLTLRLPDQIQRFKKYTTLCTTHRYDTENLISISIDEFNSMIKSGQFVSYYKECGFFFGICRDDLCKCIIESKIGLIDTNLETALVLKSSGFYPTLVLCVVEETSSYMEKLRTDFIEMDLCDSFFSKTPKIYDSEVSDFNKSKENEDKEEIASETQDDFRSISSKTPSLCSSCMINCGKNGKISNRVMQRLNMFHDSTSDIQGLDISTTENDPDQDFKWSWSLESSETAESEPDKNYLMMQKYQETFISSMIEEQSQYIELSNDHPSLFMATLWTDNTEGSLKTIEEICYKMLETREDQLSFDHLTDSNYCVKFVEKRAESLLKNLLNFST